jgi:hypothetical protein
MNRVIFLVDGFNLYHSVVEAQDDSGGQCLKWLDVHRLCSSLLHPVRAQLGVEVSLEGIDYFSAPPTHCPQGTQNRHALYMRCLRSAGVRVHLGRFKRKIVECHLCHNDDVRHEEKETDVAMAARLFEICHSSAADSVVIMTGDTDLAPAVRTCLRLFPSIFMCFAFPYKRKNAELKRLAPASFKIKRRNYFRHQYPDPLELPNGQKIKKPSEWQ